MNILKNKKGFSIAEIVVVLFIMSMGMVGVLSLSARNIKTQNINKNRIIAHQLTQEGLEIIRNVRDWNWKNSNDYNVGLSNGNYRVDYSGYLQYTTANIDSAKLQIKDDGTYIGFYVHDSNEPDSIFSRLITIATNDANSIKVTCLVQWNDRGGIYQYTSQELLYDWN